MLGSNSDVNRGTMLFRSNSRPPACRWD